jgi:hypothetical protein
VDLILSNCINTETLRTHVFTDAGGRIGLGELPFVSQVNAMPNDSGIAGRSFRITPARSNHTPSKLWANADDEEQFAVPHALAGGETGIGRARLFSIRGSIAGVASSNLYGAPCADSVIRADVSTSLRFDADRRCLVASGLAAGRYVLLRRGSDPLDATVQAIAVTIAPRGATDSAAGAAAAAAAGAAASASASAAGAGAGAASPRATADAAATSLSLLADAGCFVSRPLSQPSQITSVTASPTSLTIATTGGVHPSSTSAGGRVHVFIDHFFPECGSDRSFGDSLGGIGRNAAERQIDTSSTRARSQYLDAARLGEEHAYVLARQGKEVFPGNSLPRPSLLNTPWSQRTTKSEEQTAKAGEALGREKHAQQEESRSVSSYGGGGHGKIKRRKMPSSSRGGGGGSFNLHPSFDFLAAPAFAALNLRPGDDGVVTLSLEDAFGSDPELADAFRVAGACATVVFCDGFTTASARVCIPSSSTGTVTEDAEIDTSGAGPLRKCYRDLTLEESLDTGKHFVQKKQIVSLQPGEGTTLTAASDTQAEEYGTVDKALRLMSTLSGDARILSEFSWLGRWHKLPEDERRRKYSKYACHEVNLFLYFKDREWFDAVARPFVSSKRAKTFIDHYVLDHDMGPYAVPGRYSTLNPMERALLAGRAAGAAGSAAFNGVRALLNQLSVGAQERLFNAAISSNALEDEQDDRLRDGIKEQKRAAPRSRRAEQPSSAMVQELMMEEEEDDAMDFSFASAAAPFADVPPMSMQMASAAPMPTMEMSMAMPQRSRQRAPSRKMAAALDGSAKREAATATRRRRQMFRAVDKTEELAETHYWNVRAGRQTEKTIVADGAFWADLAAHMGGGGAASGAFVSSHFAEAVSSINEVLCAVAVMGLPFEMPEPSAVATAAGKLSWTATESPLVLFKVDVSEAEAPASSRVLVGQNFFDPTDRTHTDADGTRVEKYIESGEFVRNKVYGVQVVVTNVSASHRQLRVLMQIPQGALPANAGFVTRTKPVTLSAYETQTLEFSFYFPFLGTFPMFPAHISAGESLEAFAHPVTVNVVMTPTVVDKTSWRYIANEASLERCVEYLRTENLLLNGVNVGDVAWRCADEAGYIAITAALRDRCEWSTAVFGYAYKHGDVPGMLEYAMHPEASASSVIQRLLPRFDGGALSVSAEQGVGATGSTVAPVAYTDFFQNSVSDGDSGVSGIYEHLEYSPLINSRAHQLGTKRTIPNLSMGAQYKRLLGSIAHASPTAISAADRLALVYLLLLQDRVDAALAHFAKVAAPADCAAAGGTSAGSASASAAAASVAGSAAGSASWCALAYDYMAAYLDFYKPEEGLTVARSVAAAYTDYPVPRWAAKFAAIASQIQDIDSADARATAGGAETGSTAVQSSSKGGTTKGTRDEDLGKELIREQQMSSASGGEATLEIELNKGDEPTLRVVASNVATVEVRYYCMDVELLFSSKPFVSAGGGAASAGGGFSFVKPNRSQTVDVSSGAGAAGIREVTVPVDTSVGSNLLIEVVAGGKRRSVTFFASTLDVEVMEAAGRIRVTSAADGRPIARAYVKVFGSTTSSGDGSDAFFFKDCYTSATGVADYASVSTDALDRVQRFAVLVVTKEHGAVVRTARKPGM